MNIALRVLVILILLMNGTALFFAIQLAGKREMLQDRANVFESNVITLARTFEAADPAKPAVIPEFIGKDIDTVTPTQIETPTRSEFWDSYKFEYETTGNAMLNISGETEKLRSVYPLDSEGKPKLVGGRKDVNGPLQSVLNDVKARATAQFALLNSTRAELKKLREELNETYGQFNDLKTDARKDKATIVELREQIDQLNATIAELNGKIQTLTAAITSLENEKAELTNENAKLIEEKTELEDEVANLNAQIEEYRTKIDPKNIGAVNLTAGVKAEVVTANNQLKFAIIRVTDEALVEFVGTPEQPRALPTNELLIQHPGNAEGLVGKLRMRMLTANSNLVVCEILNDWQQGEVLPGDVVFYL